MWQGSAGSLPEDSRALAAFPGDSTMEPAGIEPATSCLQRAEPAYRPNPEFTGLYTWLRSY